jgi:hypothetical protein
LKLSSPLFAAVAAAAFALTALGQSHEAQKPQPGGAAEHHHHDEPAPTNLKVLPKDMTGEQVHELMHKWAGDLGAECSTCHAADPNRKMPNGRPALNFADDSKEEKNTARLMYRMMGDINKNYLSKVPEHHHDRMADHDHDKVRDKDHDEVADHDHDKAALSCGTCHRGHVHPPAFTPPKADHDHDHRSAPAGAQP